MIQTIEPGTIVTVRGRGLAVRGGSPAYFLGMRGNGMKILTDAAIAEACPHQVSVSPFPSFEPMRLRLAYGVWTELDGTKVLFSRDYFPLWRISSDGEVSPDDPWRWVDFVEEEFFWDDRNPPWRSPKTAREVEERMKRMGVVGHPKLMDAVEILIANPEIDIRDAVRMLAQPGDEPPPQVLG